MNQTQSQTVISLSKQIDNFNFHASIRRIYPERTEIENIFITQLTIAEFFNLTKRVMGQFVTELQDRDNYIILPFTFTNIQLGQANIDDQISAFFSNLNGDNYSRAENILFWLISYQVENGFFNKKHKRHIEQTTNAASKLSEKLGLLEINIENKLKKVDDLYTQLESNRREIQSFISQKNEELATITSNLKTTATQSNQINDLLNKSTEQSARLTAIVEQQELSKRQSVKRLNELENLYEKTNTELNSNSKKIVDQLNEFTQQVIKNTEHINFFEGKRDFFEERIIYLQNLIGQEVGANLFKTFKFRKEELDKPVILWRAAVPIMVVLTIAWIFFLFYNQPKITNTNLWWQTFAVNTLKSTPTLFLLFFTINQYRKERNFQEEYAFKSAVALTIDAYAGRLTNMENRDKLIMEAVFGIYKTPITDNQKAFEINKSTTALDTIKSMADTTKELVKNTK